MIFADLGIKLHVIGPNPCSNNFILVVFNRDARKLVTFSKTRLILVINDEMIASDGCSEWFHRGCIKTSSSLDIDWLCSNCKLPTKKATKRAGSK